MLGVAILYCVFSMWLILKLNKEIDNSYKSYNEMYVNKHNEIVVLNNKYKSLQEEYEYCSNKLTKEVEINKHLIKLLKENK